MKEYNSILLVIIAILVLTSCQKSNKSNDTLTVFNLKGPIKTEEVILSDLGTTDIQYIPLQTDTNCLITKIKKIKIASNSFIILDIRGQIYQFGFNGKFINKIGKVGRGPNEYLFPSDFAIDNNKQRIFICPSIGETGMYIYLLNGQFVNIIPCPKYTNKIYYMDEEILCWNDNWAGKANIKDNLILVDDKGTILKKYADKYKYKNTIFPNGVIEGFLMYDFNGILYSKEIYSDTVFAFKNYEFKPAFVLDHGGMTMPVKAREKIINMKTAKKAFYQYSQQINLFEFSNYVYSEFYYQNKCFGFIGSFNEKGWRFINLDIGIYNDIDGGINIQFKTAKDRNTIVSWTDAYELKKHIASDEFKNSTPKFPEKKKELEELANSLDETDNPVLMLVKLKE